MANGQGVYQHNSYKLIGQFERNVFVSGVVQQGDDEVSAVSELRARIV